LARSQSEPDQEGGFFNSKKYVEINEIIIIKLADDFLNNFLMKSFVFRVKTLEVQLRMYWLSTLTSILRWLYPVALRKNDPFLIKSPEN